MARAACVYNVENKEICYIKGEEEILYPASTAKMMTGLLALEFYTGSLETQITVTQEMLGDSNRSNINIGLMAGEVVTAEDLINAVIIGGAADAAYALAYSISGSTTAFVEKMNQRALELEMTSTFYSNPTGEHTARMVTSIGDVIKLSAAAYATNGFTDMAGTAEYDIPATNLTERQRAVRNRNYFISAYYDTRYRDGDVFGLNAGSTSEAGYCVVAVENDGEGKTFITAVMGAVDDDNENYGYTIAENLMIWVNDAYSFTTVLEATRIICEFPVILSDKKDKIPLLPEKKIDALLPSGVDVASEITVDYVLTEKNFAAPVTSGMVAGTVSAYYEGRLLGTVNLVSKSTVERSNIKYFFRQLLGLLTKPLFYLVILLIFVGYRIYKYISQKHKKERETELQKQKLRREYDENLRKKTGNGRGRKKDN